MDEIQKIIGTNILEESSLPGILDELVQEIKHLARQELMYLAAAELRSLAAANAAEFYRIGKEQPFIDLPVAEAVGALSRGESWTHRGVHEDIHVYAHKKGA